MKKILIIDDENMLIDSLSRTLKHHGYLPTTAHSKKEFHQMSTNSFFDIALLDLKLPDGDGLELMKYIKQKNPNTQVIIMTGYGTIDLAVSATKQGAFHFITKPFNMGEIINLCSKALSQCRLETENARLRSCVKKQYRFDQIIGQSQPILNLLEMIKKIASSSSTVLITGESGTGKELVAKSIHFNSEQNHGPFIPVHCGAIPKDLLESELFGHVKGAFTGAIKDRIGRFQMAEGGTLFLDEISTMDPSTQVKLLRVLQEKEFQPVGGDRTIQYRTRVISASNENLEQAVKKGTFREDLYYRLNVIPLFIPPLRKRKDDIPLLINYFIKNFNEKRTNKLKGISPSTMQYLCKYPWPGNIRELENMIERLCVLKETEIVQDTDLPPQYINQNSHNIHSDLNIPESGLDFNNTVKCFENDLILKALKKTRWNRNQAAKLLKLNRTTLLEKIKKKGLKEDIPSILNNLNKPTPFLCMFMGLCLFLISLHTTHLSYADTLKEETLSDGSKIAFYEINTQPLSSKELKEIEARINSRIKTMFSRFDKQSPKDNLLALHQFKEHLYKIYEKNDIKYRMADTLLNSRILLLSQWLSSLPSAKGLTPKNCQKHIYRLTLKAHILLRNNNLNKWLNQMLNLIQKICPKNMKDKTLPAKNMNNKPLTTTDMHLG